MALDACNPDDEASTSTGAFTAVDAIDSVAATGAPLPDISAMAFNAALQAASAAAACRRLRASDQRNLVQFGRSL